MKRLSAAIAIAVVSCATLLIVLSGAADTAMSGQATGTSTSTTTPQPVATNEPPAFLVRATNDAVVWDAVPGAASYIISGNVSGVSYTLDGNCADDIIEDFFEPLSGTTQDLSFPFPLPDEPAPPGQRWAVTSLDASVIALDDEGGALAQGSFSSIGEPTVCAHFLPTATTTPARAQGGGGVRPPDTGHGPDSY